jgi:hypothetical protein
MTHPRDHTAALREAFEAHYVQHFNTASGRNDMTMADIEKMRGPHGDYRECAYIHGAWFGWRAHSLSQPQQPADSMVAVARRNLRAYLGKASFATNVDRHAALTCLDVLEEAIAHPAEQQECKPPAKAEGSGEPVDQAKWDAAFEVVSAYLRGRQMGADIGQVAALCDVVAFAAEQQEGGDAAMLDWLKNESCDLRCIDMPTGAGDSDVHWVVIEHHMAAPHEREIGRSYTDDPRDAIRAAMTGGNGNG